MKRYYILVLLAFILLVPLVSSEAERAYPTLPGSISSPSFGYVVHYDDTDPLSADYMPAAQAQFMVDTGNNDDTPSVGNPNGLHVGYTDVGFKAPDFLSSTRNLYTYACTNCDSGCAPADAILMPASMYDTSGEQCIRSVLGHELFHHVQFAYITFNKWPNWVHPLEGTARMFQDKFYNDLDAWNGAGCCCGYVGEINGYLANPNRTIWDLSYPSVLWWTYLTEQLGTLNAEPNAGADFVVELWERAEANNSPVDVVKAVREAIAAFTSRSMESMFQDFTITNYTKQLDLSLLPSPARYRYRDESDGNGLIFNSVAWTWGGLAPHTASSDVKRWGARYFEADVSSCGDGVVGFHSEGDQAGYALIPIKGTDKVQSINKATVANYSRALLQTSASPFKKLGVVVTGGNTDADFTYTFDCGQVDMYIREPKHPDPIAYVGAYNEPERFLVKVRVQGPASLGTPSVEGLDSDDFTVFVGNHSDPANEAEVINGAYVQGEYWLVVQAPEKESPEPDTYNLTVKLGNIAIASNEAAVVYATKSVDQMLVIDKSGSMDYPTGYSKIDAAKEAGKLFVDSARRSDYTGVVSFSGDMSEPNDDATLEYKLQPVTEDSRLEAKEAIQLIETENMTSIGDGMYLAYDEIVNSGNGRPAPPTERWIILLSDGMENEAAYWDNVKNYVHDNNIKVNAIALGPMSDQPLMQSIAAYTGGRYYYVDLPPATTSTAEFEGRAISEVLMELGDAYALSAERIQTHERLWENQGWLSAGEVVELYVDVREESVEDPLFTLSWSGGVMGDYNIYDPDGTSIGNLPDVEINRDEYHATFRLPRLAPGTWTIYLRAYNELGYRATLSGINRYGAQLQLFFGAYGMTYELDTNQFLLNQPVPIIASLTDMKGSVLEAQVRASIEHPDESNMSISLYDDGNHGDGFPADGIYGGLYYRTTVGSKTSQTDEKYEKRGSYIVTLLAEGKDNIGGEFQRVARGSFSVIEPLEPTFEFEDTDEDGLINLYENLYPCMAYDAKDSHLDPDFDDLASLDEFNLGTNPCNPDTDNGGENDQSEIKRNANPLDGSDDLLPQPIDVGVISQVSHDLGDPGLKPYANLIRYPASLAYQRILLFRRTSLSDPYILIDEFDAQAEGGLYYDEGLTAGIRYYYRLIGVNGETMSAPSGEFSGIPRANPIPPVGGIVINNHAMFVTSIYVRLHLPLDLPYTITGEGLEENRAGIEMLIGNDPLFTERGWQPYDPDPEWTLSPDGEGNADVYVKFRDEEGSESETYHANVIVLSPDELGGIQLRVLLQDYLARDARATLITQAGVVVIPEGETGLPPAYTDAEGNAILENLPPGLYKLIVQFHGYIPLIIEDIEVIGGEINWLGEVILVPWQTFLPIIIK